MGVHELAGACKADAVFLGQSMNISSMRSTAENFLSGVAVRIMRVIVALGLCAESGIETYKANTKTKIMTIPQGISSFKTW